MSLDQLQAERAQYEADLADIELMLADEPDLAEALEVKPTLIASIQELDAKIAALSSQSQSQSQTTASSSEKWSKDKHPAYRKQTEVSAPAAPEKKAPTTFKVNDTVLAKYYEDKQFYEARIMSVTGSSAAPIYTVNFKGYSGTQTLHNAHDLRPLPSASSSAAQKRKADGSPVVSTPLTPTVSTPALPGVISAEANINPALANAVKREQIKALDADPRGTKPAKKVKTSKALESSKNNWKSWQSKASSGKAAKVVQKDSMFRTGEAPSARVGFTGSGQAMRKDVTRTRHNYTLD